MTGNKKCGLKRGVGARERERCLLDWDGRGSYSEYSGQEDFGERCDWTRRGVT